MCISDQLFLGQPTVGDRRYNFHESPQIVRLPLVVPEGLFVEVAEEVKRLTRDIRPLDGPLQQGPEVLHPVRPHLPPDVLFGIMTDRLMDILGRQPYVAGIRVRVDPAPLADGILDLRLKRFLLRVRDDRCNDLTGIALAAAFQHSHDNSFPDSSPSLDDRFPLRLVHVPGLPSDIRLIGFYRPAELRERPALHRQPDTMQQEPCALLCDTEGAMDLIRRDAVLRIGNQPHCREPRRKRKRAIFHDRTSLQRETLLASFASPETLCCIEPMIASPALRACYPVLPTESFYILETGIWIREIDNGFLKSSRVVIQKYGKSRNYPRLFDIFTMDFRNYFLPHDSQVCYCPNYLLVHEYLDNCEE